MTFSWPRARGLPAPALGVRWWWVPLGGNHPSAVHTVPASECPKRGSLLRGGEGPHAGFPVPTRGTHLPSVETAERVPQAAGPTSGLRSDRVPTTCQASTGHGADGNSKDGSGSWGLRSRQERHLQKQIQASLSLTLRPVPRPARHPTRCPWGLTSSCPVLWPQASLRWRECARRERTSERHVAGPRYLPGRWRSS